MTSKSTQNASKPSTDGTGQPGHDASQTVQNARDIDPNVLQRLAASPESSVWVGASAGSGKTKVLADRVLRLLLPAAEGRPGSPPHKILCITFTKAAASEMALRIGRILGSWATMKDEDLAAALSTLLGRTPRKDEINAARRLFAEVTDAPGGLQIMTVHAFCQSVLGRFPLEAGLSPGFEVLDEGEARRMLSAARDAVFAEAEKASPVATAIRNVAGIVNDDQFLELIESIGRERYQLHNLLEKGFGVDGLYSSLCQTLNIQPGRSPADIIAAVCEDKAFAAANLKNAATNASRDKAAMRANLGAGTLDWFALSPTQRAAKFENYCSLYLTQKGLPNGKIFTGAFMNTPDASILMEEAQRLIAVQDSVKAANCASYSRDLLQLGKAILDTYQQAKLRRGLLDYDDLIISTVRLLQQKDMAAWVLFKLDQGIDHILVDEAQDTNPEQWDIALTLAEEFFAGLGQRENTERTAFAVGDEKQSIYSFQRASPQRFAAARTRLKQLVEGAKKDWQEVPVNISFRSTPSVLQVVDATFADPELHQSLVHTGIDSISHIPAHSRRRQAGRVELWPLCETPEDPDSDPWDPPVTVIERQTGAAKLANDIAGEIRSWLDKGEKLLSRNRSIRPEDILILVRSRNAFVQQLARAIKSHNIPVSGSDRMVLNEQLAVQDMLAAAEFALLPSDNLTLATLLKSPLIGWDEDRLYNYAAGREGTLWNSLLHGNVPETQYLKHIIDLSRSQAPYEFFSTLLQQSCPADATSGMRAFKRRLGPDCLDPLQELLNTALAYGSDNVPNLQGFLKWQSQESGGIRREMEEARGEVRIMTIHGSKGLQAPIVILPDTIKSSAGQAGHNDRRLLWPDKSGLPAPIWCPRTEDEPAIFTTAKGRYDDLQRAESHRLLYVAMTRAEDRLYIAGHTGKAAAKPESWYFAVKRGLERLEGVETLKNGRLRLENSQIGDPDKPDQANAADIAFADIPEWLHRPAPPEPVPVRPLAPSRPSENDGPLLSPLSNDGTHRFRRGNLTHKLLQFLPELPDPAREQAARTYIERYGNDLPQETKDSIVTETLKVLDHTAFAPIFGPGSQAEVPLTGLVNGRIISGQIDRLLITDKEILIIDYKTNRPPPKDPKDVPLIYYNQMRAYAETLRVIYPGRTIRCALLWTDGTRLMELQVEG